MIQVSGTSNDKAPVYRTCVMCNQRKILAEFKFLKRNRYGDCCRACKDETPSAQMRWLKRQTRNAVRRDAKHLAETRRRRTFEGLLSVPWLRPIDPAGISIVSSRVYKDETI
jgi:hypothetical protein